jgi:hypothetical protein
MNLYAIDFFNSLNEAERLIILTFARQAMRRTKVAKYSGDTPALKQHLFLLERIEKFMQDDGFGGYTCDVHDCDADAVYYNSNTDAFYCEEHN